MSADELKAKGNAAFSAKNFEEAIEHFTAAIEVDGTNHVFYSNRSAAFASLGQFNSALEDGNKVVEMKPDWPKGYNRKGAALQGLGKIEEAIACYEEGLKIDPNNAALKQARDTLQQQEEQAGANLFQSLAPMLGGLSDPNLLGKLATNPQTMTFASQPDFIAKIKEIQSNPQNLTKHLSDQRIAAALNVVMQESMGAMGQQPPAASAQPEPQQAPPQPKPAEKKPEPAPEPVVEKELTEEEKKKQAALDLKKEGNEFYKKKQFEEALEKYNKAIETDSTEMSFHLNKAAVYLEMKKFEDCIKSCHTAIDVGRSNRVDYKFIAKAFLRIGNANLKQEKFDEAIAAYESSLTEAHSDEASKKLKETKKRKIEFEEKAYLDDGKALEAKEKGNDFFRSSDFSAALAQYQESVKRNPNNAPVYSNMAACFGKLGDFPRAIEYCDKCIALDATFVKAFTRKAGFQFYLKEYYKAIETYNKALELDPNNAEAKDGLVRTRMAMQQNMGDEERAQHAMADPEIQAILSDPVIQQVLNDFKTNPTEAQKHLRDAGVAAKLQKLIDAGILSTR